MATTLFYTHNSKKQNSVYIVHLLPGRVRIFVPGLYKWKETAETINRLLAQVEGVYYIHTNPLTARVLVTFDEKKCSIEKIVHLLVHSKHCGPGTLEAASTGEVTALKPVEDKDLHSSRVIEPEDLPISRQLFNVALGGGVLALLTLKRFTLGKSRLAGSQRLFNLAAVGRLSPVGATLFNNLISIVVSLNSLAFGVSARKKRAGNTGVSKNKASPWVTTPNLQQGGKINVING